MARFCITGGKRLCGQTQAGAAKNAALPILAACMLATQPVRVRLPDLSDVRNMLKILRLLGCGVSVQGDWADIDAQSACCWRMPADLSGKMRSSIFMLGPILARFGKAEFTYPGGCEIGLRPIDLHLSGLRALGVTVRETGGRILCAGSLHGARVHLDYPSVGATENLLMAAVLAQGETVIDNAAMEPEIEDLAAFLQMLGAKIQGAGTARVTIQGVETLGGGSYEPMPDRIVAGTLLAAAAITGGDVLVRDARAQDMAAVLSKFEQMGCTVEIGQGVRLIAPRRLQAFRTLDTRPYPGFPTDMQAQLLTLACVAEGAGAVTENVFENRFGYTAELSGMGADIQIHGRTAFVRGVAHLTGARVYARDLRAGAALTLAGLCARGETIVEGVSFIDRGYAALETTLAALGACIRRETD